MKEKKSKYKSLSISEFISGCMDAQEFEITREKLRKIMGISKERFSFLFEKNGLFSETEISNLVLALGGSVSYWTNMQNNYIQSR